ncbi:hypothetical protein KAX08_09025 [candidate division WOR-3 bacterium]|nr:hypothetical protein [candidate division WOR-3 bacterium]
MLKKFFLTLFLLIFVFSWFGINGCGKKSPPEPGRYYNKTKGFSIKFPKGWEIFEGQTEEDPVVEAVSPWESDSDMLSEFISIYVDELPNWMDLDDYYSELSINSENELAHYQEEDSGTSTIDDTYVKWLIFSYTVAEGAMQNISYLFFKDHQAYIITCNSEPEKFYMYKSKFEEVAQSFKFE